MSPTCDVFQWALTTIGNDSITISVNDANAQFPATYTIGVYGFGAESIYTLLVTQAGTVNLLLDGISQYNHITAHTMQLYEFDPSSYPWPPVDVEITVTPISGSVQLYVAQGSSADFQPSLTCSSSSGESNGS